MGNCKVDIKDLERFTDKMYKNLTGNELDSFIDDCCKELAARLLAKVIKRTPVGQYPADSGKKGGTLRRGWTGGKKTAATSYAEGLDIQHAGNAYVVEVKNPVEYASYVEYGHRQTPGRFVPAIGKKLKKGWVEGQFFLTISEDELQRVTPAILERKLKKKIKEMFT